MFHSKTDIQDSEKHIFAELSVGRAVFTMVIPTVISQIIIVIYNMADT